MKVDVIINVYGKPWQTLCTLKSLMKHSGDKIDTIYFIEEKKQPYNENIQWVINQFDNVIHFIPKDYSFKIKKGWFWKKSNRYMVRYQYGIEKSNKTFVFLTHNDVLYKNDIIGNLIKFKKDAIGIGSIGQCWNCPALAKGVCSSYKFEDYKPTYSEIMQSFDFPHIRTKVENIDKKNPMPLPECRLNEWSCLIDKNITIKECYPFGKTPLFGMYDGLDVGCGYFRSLILKGYKFKNYNVDKDSVHGFWANDAGYPTQLNEEKYFEAELSAKKYFLKHFKSLSD